MSKNKWEEYGKWRHGELREKYMNINNLDTRYQALLQDILDNGVEKSDRTGTGTLSVFGRQIRHKMREGFPLLTTKKMHWNSVVTELLWFLRGDTNIKFLLDYDCHIWDGDAYKNYSKAIENVIDGYKSGDIMGMQPHIENWFSNSDELTPLTKEEFIKNIKTDKEFAERWGDLGLIYGKQWRSWKGDTWIEGNTDGTEGFYLQTEEIDQIQNLINELKTNPDSRRLMVSAWNPSELDQMVLPPCHYGFQVYTRELSKFERSRWWGLPEGEHFLDDVLDKHNIPKRAISLMWNQRSVDTFLGLPFNIASYGLLLEILAKEVNMVPDELIGNLGDVHLYKNHIEQAKEQMGRDLTDEERYNKWFNNNVVSGMERFFDPNNLPDFDDPHYEPTPKRTREPFELPKIQITERNWYQHQLVKEHLGEKTFSEKILSYRPDCFELIGYESHPKIKAPLSN
jgi:thymidylate synthase